MYSRYVAKIKKQEGLYENYMAAISAAHTDNGVTENEKYKIRREISFLSELRRNIVFSFYYKNETIKKIAARHGIPEGTVKWHLNKIKKDLKEGMTMERKIGELGLNPVKALDISHNGTPGRNGGPEYYLQDKIDLNIVYSAYNKPRTLNEIAERTYSLENMDRIRDVKLRIADQLIEKYVPVVRKCIANLQDVYIPGGNRELFEAAAIMYALRHKCTLKLGHSYDYNQYRIDNFL